MLEKANYPRNKLCAGGLTADAEFVLRSLGLDLSEVPHVDVPEVHLDFAGKGLTVALRKAHALRIIRRDEFDAWLAEKARAAGIEIREGVTVRRVMPGVSSALVEADAGTFEAAVVVGADGSNGVTRRSILPNAPIHTARALEVLFATANSEEHSDGSNPRSGVVGQSPLVELSPSVPLSRDRGRVGPVSAGSPQAGWRQSTLERGGSMHAADIAYFDFAPVPHGIAGYTWDFPTQLKGRPMRCWGIYDTNLLAHRQRRPLQQTLADEMQRHGASLDDLKIQGHPIRWFSPFGALSVSRVILVGDAAGADGIFGEGISIALGYGRIAAEAILDAVSHDDYSFRDYHRRVLRSPLGRALTVRTAITRILYRLHWAWFQRFFWRMLKPAVLVVSFMFVLNWARRTRRSPTRH